MGHGTFDAFIQGLAGTFISMSHALNGRASRQTHLIETRLGQQKGRAARQSLCLYTPGPHREEVSYAPVLGR